MNERRYRDEEVRTIFKLATSDKIAHPPASISRSGLTLPEMQSIALEVGIEPDAVARAAAALDAPASLPARTTLGVPVEVGLNVPLPGPMTDEQWAILVAELRSTFHAKGRITTDGALREWRNGNLHASVEPTERGYRLRLGTVKGNAAAVNALGAAGLLASAITWTTHAVINDPHMILAPVVFTLGGIGAFLANRLRLPAWARDRERQMQYIAARARAIMETSS